MTGLSDTETMWSFYNKMLQRNPVPTEMATSAVLWFSGDLLAQYLEHRHMANETPKAAIASTSPATNINERKAGSKGSKGSQVEAVKPQPQKLKMDWHRVGVQTVYATFIWAPFGHYWYEWLDRRAHIITKSLSHTGPALLSNSMRLVAVKLALEMTLLHPIALFAFFSCVGLLSGDSPLQIITQLRNDYVPSLLLEYALWTPFDMAMFAFIPVRHQLLVVNTISLVESVMLSYIKANGVKLPGHGDENEEEKKKLDAKKKD